MQHKEINMGSTLSVAMSCLYIEALEADSYFRIIGRGSTWLRYVDNVQTIVFSNAAVENKLRLLNSVNKAIYFTIE